MRRINQTENVLEIREYFVFEWSGFVCTIAIAVWFVLLTKGQELFINALSIFAICMWLFALNWAPFFVIKFDKTVNLLTTQRIFLWGVRKETHDLNQLQDFNVIHKYLRGGSGYFLNIHFRGQKAIPLTLTYFGSTKEANKLISTIYDFLRNSDVRAG